MDMQVVLALVVVTVLVVGGVAAMILLRILQRGTSSRQLSREDAETARRTVALGEAGIATSMAVRSAATRQ